MRSLPWLLLMTSLAGCGGSASETPPPLPPTRKQVMDAARRDQERAAAEAKRDKDGDASKRVTTLPEIEDERRPAPSTWGGSDQLRLK